MCNPTPNPPPTSHQPSTSSSSSSSPTPASRRSQQQPPSPASTPFTRMSSSSSSSSAAAAALGRDGNATRSSSSSPRIVRDGAAAALILKLVTSMRSSPTHRTPTSTRRNAPRRIVVRRNNERQKNGRQESRDDSHGWLQPPPPQQTPTEDILSSLEDQLPAYPLPLLHGSTNRFVPEEDEEDAEDDDIPDLISEDDHDRYQSSPLHTDEYHNWQQHQQQHQQFRTQSLRREPRAPILDSHPQPNQQQPQQPQPSNQKQQQQQQQNQKTKKQQQQQELLPFFVLEGMIEDLVPAHQNVLDLAKILKEQESPQRRPFSPLRKSKSCGMTFGSISSSTSISTSTNNYSNNSYTNNKFLPWLPQSKRAEIDDCDHYNYSNNKIHSIPQQHYHRKLDGNKSVGESTNATDTTIVTTATTESPYRPSSPLPSTPNKDVPPMPVTPKSSNRKSSKKDRPQWRVGHLIAPNSQQQQNEALLIPRNLDFNEESDDSSFSLLSSSVSQPRTSHNTIAPSLTLSPRPVFSVPQTPAPSPSVAEGTPTTGSTSTRKVASCPQLYVEKSEKAEQLLRQRAKEQHDRRERRNKLTVVQRSLTLARGWNNKGLNMAGKATQVEQWKHQRNNATPQDCNPGQWWASALECWGNAFEIYRSLLGDSHERVADVQNNRGIALGKLGRFEEALSALGMALDARKKQKERAETKSTMSEEQQQSKESQLKSILPATAAIVSTLHNIANVFRDAGNPDEALRVLVDAQNTLLSSERDHLSSSSSSSSTNERTAPFHRHHCWHQSARLSTAIGHVYYESESWRDARDAYREAHDVYHRLGTSLARESDKLGFSNKGGVAADETKRLEILQHQQLVQQEVFVLDKDLDDLDRCQQAREGSRARIIQARRQQQQQKLSPRRPKAQSQQQQQQQQQPTPFGIVDDLRT